ncbi:MAG: hypothetical protein GQ582_10445 [Methyloprofundus sp.]|nr:hypothetical protein [Methyloprofundus sp.]
MNKYKKEVKIKHDKARKGLSEDEIIAVDLEDEIKLKIEELSRSIHAEKFAEEYDFMYDSGVDAKERKKGINPMNQEYIDKIKQKRADLGLTQLSENGISVSQDSENLCLEEAKRQVYSDLKLKRPPEKTCVFCHKALNEIGGKRIIAQKFRGVALSKKKTGGGNKDYPHQSIPLFSNPNIFIDIWGEKEKWNEASIKSAKNSYLNGKQPWFCQICGERKCSHCDSPINYPMGSDILYGNGCSSHVAILPIDPGCNNSACDQYKKWEDNQ